jgi:4-hydroxy-4-methyl-2-oxoglutarate aldolase
LPTELDGLTVPTIANAVELFRVVPPNEGFTRRPLTCHFPELGMCAGHAVTLTAVTDEPADAIVEREYWKWLDDQPGPRLVVVQDIGAEPAGAMWGEWNANVHLALGCIGTVTDGAVRDLDALERLGFHAFATSVSVAHGYGVFTSYGAPISVAGLAVASGDLVLADRHGVLRVPPEIPLAELADVARRIDGLEAEVFAYCQSPGFSVEGLAELDASVHERWPRPR